MKKEPQQWFEGRHGLPMSWSAAAMGLAVEVVDALGRFINNVRVSIRNGDDRAMMRHLQLRSRSATLLRCVAGAALLCTTVVATAATASASTRAAAPSGRHLTFMTVQQGEAQGIYPGMSYEGSTPSPVVTIGKLRPASASGCNQNICIQVTGSGLTVSDWSTSAYFTDATESFAAYWANGSVIATSPAFNASPGTWYYDDWGHSGTFANGTILCNTWFDNLGKPCETVHS